MTHCRKGKEYIGLRSIRGIGAILIFYHHFGFDSAVTDSFGDFAVSLFFMLSGLVLSMTYNGYELECDPQTIGIFMKKRIFKIYPVYFLSLLAAIFVMGCYYLALPFDLLLLQSWIPQAKFFFSGNSVSWFVSSLFFSYLMFIPLQRALSMRHNAFIKLFGLGIVIYIVIAAFIPEHLVKGIIYINPVMELPAFVIGMLIWHFFGRSSRLDANSDKNILCLQVAAIILSIIFIYLFRYVNPRWTLASFWWLPNAFLLTILLLSEGKSTPINHVLSLRIFRFIGNISFTFYLFHTIVIAIYRQVITRTAIDIPFFPSSLVCLTLTLAIAYILHYYVELPIARKLKEFT